MVALTTAYREWMRQEEEEEEEEEEAYRADYSPVTGRLVKAENQDNPLGIRRWRWELKKTVMDYVIVFQGSWYGSFHVMEFTVLARYHVKLLPEELGTRDCIFSRYGLDPPD